MFRAATAPPAPGLHNERVRGDQKTTSVCKRARRMARPSEPSDGANLHAENIVNELERELALDGYVRAVVKQETQTFKHTAPSTGKGPAVRAETGDAESDAAAQAIMNQMVSIKSRRVDTNNLEPAWLMDEQNACPQMYGRLAANAIKRYTRHSIAPPEKMYLTLPFPCAQQCRQSSVTQSAPRHRGAALTLFVRNLKNQLQGRHPSGGRTNVLLCHQPRMRTRKSKRARDSPSATRWPRMPPTRNPLAPRLPDDD